MSARTGTEVSIVVDTEALDMIAAGLTTGLLTMTVSAALLALVASGPILHFASLLMLLMHPAGS